jgi:hypothetical protein
MPSTWRRTERTRIGIDILLVTIAEAVEFQGEEAVEFQGEEKEK